MTGRGFAVHPTTSKPGIFSAGAQLVTGHVWEVSLGGNGLLQPGMCSRTRHPAGGKAGLYCGDAICST